MSRVDWTTRGVGVQAKVFLLIFLVSIAGRAHCQQGFPAQTSTNADATRVAIVSLTDRKLAVIEDGVVIATFSVAVGAVETPSPIGEFRIVSRVSNPTYYHPGLVVPSGKNNPVGTRWLGLSQKGYGIHGTNAPKSVGHRASHGCIRMRNHDIERLYTLLQIGDVVEIHGEHDARVAQVFGDRTDDTTVASTQMSAQDGGQ